MVHILPLSKPVTAHGAEASSLTIRLPTGKDIRICGLPYKLTADSEVSIDGAAMHRMIAQLAGVPPSSIDQLSASDWNSAAQMVLLFITGAEATPAPPETPTPN